jgi:mono/diheme cytochrome c family protein
MLRAVAIIALLVSVAVAGEDAAKKGPFPYTRKSIERGKNVYLRNCTACHDRDGKSYSGRDFTTTPPADLTDPDSWIHAKTGKSPEGIFTSIHDGTVEEMPPFKGKLKDEEIWDMVNFIRSIWPEAMRPKLVDE